MKSSLTNANPPQNSELRTIPQLSRLLRLSQKQIRDYVAEGCPVAIPGKRPFPHRINVADFFHWCLAKRDADNRLKKKVNREANSRLEQIKIERAELALAEARGDLIHFNDYGPFIEDRLVQMRQRLITSVVRSVRQRFDDEVAQFVYGENAAALNDLSKGLAEVPELAKAEEKRNRRSMR